MDNPADNDRTIINVKGIRKVDWEAAKRGATQQGDSMGTWLSDAIRLRVSHDANAIQGPGNPHGNTSLTPDQRIAFIEAVAALQQGTAALKAVRVRPNRKGFLAEVQSALEQHMIEASGPRKSHMVGKAGGQGRVIIEGETVIHNDSEDAEHG